VVVLFRKYSEDWNAFLAGWLRRVPDASPRWPW
jgi:hypothetical protein